MFIVGFNELSEDFFLLNCNGFIVVLTVERSYYSLIYRTMSFGLHCLPIDTQMPLHLLLQLNFGCPYLIFVYIIVYNCICMCKYVRLWKYNKYKWMSMEILTLISLSNNNNRNNKANNIHVQTYAHTYLHSYSYISL